MKQAVVEVWNLFCDFLVKVSESVAPSVFSG